MSTLEMTEQASTPSAPSPDNTKKTARMFMRDDPGNPGSTVPAIIDSDSNVSNLEGPTGPVGPVGPPGPTGPAGSLPTTDVSDITNPTEIESEGLSGGINRVAREIVGTSGEDLATTYIYDADGPAKNAPYVMNTSDGGTTRWVAYNGLKQQTPSDAADGSRFITSAEQTKLAGIETGAEVNDPFADAAPPDITDSTGAIGVSTDKAREDHTHGHGNRGGGSLHAAATPSANGFMSSADKSKLDNLAASDFNLSTRIEDEFPPNNEDTDELGALGWRRTSSGTGNQGVMIDGVALHPGIYRMGSGTAAAARSTIYLGEPGNDMLVLGNGIVDYDCIVRGTAAIGQFERFLAGLAQRVTTNAEWTDGVYFRILTGGTNWEFVTANSGTRTAIDTGISYVSGNWIRLGFTINAAANSIQARINGSDVGSAITTNIPVLPLSLTFLAGALATGAGSNSTLDADFVRLDIAYSANRND